MVLNIKGGLEVHETVNAFSYTSDITSYIVKPKCVINTSERLNSTHVLTVKYDKKRTDCCARKVCGRG